MLKGLLKVAEGHSVDIVTDTSDNPHSYYWLPLLFDKENK